MRVDMSAEELLLHRRNIPADLSCLNEVVRETEIVRIVRAMTPTSSSSAAGASGAEEKSVLIKLFWNFRPSNRATSARIV
jgi:hypothetical protein